MTTAIPTTQWAVQLTGPDELILNKQKPVHQPGPHQVLCRVEAVGLCFSDLKLLKQFSTHARKTDILSGIDPAVLAEIPSYVPADQPTVPGHESVVRVVAVGDQVTRYKPGERYLVQTDYRWLPTANSNGSYGYNFEGGLQEYVLMDQRVITSPQGESMLIPAAESLSASAIALVEPWACVEDAYVVKERQTIKADSHMLIVADSEVSADLLKNFFAQYASPKQITWLGKGQPPQLDVPTETANDIASLPDAAFDDVIYFGHDGAVIEPLFAKIAGGGLFVIVLCGGTIGRKVTSYVGRVHYGNIRIIGTTSSDPADAMQAIPASGEIRKGDHINVVGAGGPMGVMHVVRNLCQGVPDVTVYAGDLDDNRLAHLSGIAAPLADKFNVTYKSYNPKTAADLPAFDYIALMAPVPALVSQAVDTAASGGIINIFAGIPATVTADIDLDAYIAKQLYFIGTSGSVLDDMKTVLGKLEADQLDTNLSVAAVCGLDKAVEGIRAVEHRKIDGKIIVYPACKGLPLTPLEILSDQAPAAAKALDGSRWTGQAEKALIDQFSQS